MFAYDTAILSETIHEWKRMITWYHVRQKVEQIILEDRQMWRLLRLLTLPINYQTYLALCNSTLGMGKTYSNRMVIRGSQKQSYSCSHQCRLVSKKHGSKFESELYRQGRLICDFAIKHEKRLHQHPNIELSF